MLHTKQNIFFLTYAKTFWNFGNCALLGYYAVSSWSHLQESKSWPQMIGLIQCPETLVKNQHYSLCNIPDERNSHQLCGGRMKSCMFEFYFINNTSVLNCSRSSEEVYIQLLHNASKIEIIIMIIIPVYANSCKQSSFCTNSHCLLWILVLYYKKKYMKGQKYSYVMKTFVFHMKFMFQTQFWECIPCFQSTKLCLTIQKLCLLEHTSIHILKLDNTNPIFPPTVTL